MRLEEKKNHVRRPILINLVLTKIKLTNLELMNPEMQISRHHQLALKYV